MSCIYLHIWQCTHGPWDAIDAHIVCTNKSQFSKLMISGTQTHTNCSIKFPIFWNIMRNYTSAHFQCRQISISIIYLLRTSPRKKLIFFYLFHECVKCVLRTSSSLFRGNKWELTKKNDDDTFPMDKFKAKLWTDQAM